MTLLRLPVELFGIIAEQLSTSDISHFCRTCRAVNAILDQPLYRRGRNNPDALRRAIKEGLTRTVEKLLAGGASPDQALELFPLSKYTALSLNSMDLSTHALQDYHMQLMLLEQQRHRRMMRNQDPDSSILKSATLYTPLHLAASLGRDDIINLLLDSGANTNALSRGFCSCKYQHVNLEMWPEPPWWMPLHTAICHGNYSAAQLLVTRGASFQVDARSIGSVSNYVTALHTSSRVGSLDICRLLLDHYHPPIDMKDHNGLSPLFWAYESNRWDVVEFLIKRGANTEVDSGDGYSLFFNACSSGRFKDALRLLELGASPSCPRGISPLHSCCSSTSRTMDIQPNDRLPLVKYLIETGADINAKKPGDNSTPLIFAAAEGLFHVVEYLLEAGADVNARNLHGVTPLMSACLLRAVRSNLLLSTIDLLLRCGASATIGEDTGEDALVRICRSGESHPDKSSIVKLLLEYGSLPNSSSDFTGSLIYHLFMSGDLDICETLRNLNASLPSGRELPMMIKKAVDLDDDEALQYVLQFKGATKALCTETRLYKALQSKACKVPGIILDAGAPWTYVTRAGWTCLLRACLNGDRAIVQKLLEKGADPNQSTNRRESPLSKAIIRGDLAMFEALLDYGADPFPTHSGGALIQAILGRQVEIVEAMMKRGLWDKASQHEQVQSMHVVCGDISGPVQIALLNALLCGGADPNMLLHDPLTSEGCVPLRLIMRRQNDEAVKLLISRGAVPPTATETSMQTPAVSGA
ncbi:ankyrin [Hypoxylon crocopeplum]|nr:ankyrin [Hypoxylon crocopeplum]